MNSRRLFRYDTLSLISRDHGLKHMGSDLMLPGHASCRRCACNLKPEVGGFMVGVFEGDGLETLTESVVERNRTGIVPPDIQNEIFAEDMDKAGVWFENCLDINLVYYTIMKLFGIITFLSLLEYSIGFNSPKSVLFFPANFRNNVPRELYGNFISKISDKWNI